MIQFLLDEDVTPALRDVANARGYSAYHVQYLGWKGRTDREILRRMIDEDRPGRRGDSGLSPPRG